MSRLRRLWTAPRYAADFRLTLESQSSSRWTSLSSPSSTTPAVSFFRDRGGISFPAMSSIILEENVSIDVLSHLQILSDLMEHLLETFIDNHPSIYVCIYVCSHGSAILRHAHTTAYMYMNIWYPFIPKWRRRTFWALRSGGWPNTKNNSLPMQSTCSNVDPTISLCVFLPTSSVALSKKENIVYWPPHIMHACISIPLLS